MLTFICRRRSAAKARLKWRGVPHPALARSSRRIALSGAAPRDAARRHASAPCAPRDAARRHASAPCAPLTSDAKILAAAYDLHDLEMQVVPVPRLHVERHSEQPLHGYFNLLANASLYSPLFPQLFRNANLAVMVGERSENLFVIACASPSAFAWVQAQLARLDIAAWVSSTDRGSCFWLRGAEGVVRNGAPAPDIEVLGSSGCVLCPPSVDAEGVSCRWLDRPGGAPPVVSVAQLDFLRLEVEAKGRSSFTSGACQVVDEYGVENAAAAKRRKRQEARNIRASERLLRQKA